MAWSANFNRYEDNPAVSFWFVQDDFQDNPESKRFSFFDIIRNLTPDRALDKPRRSSPALARGYAWKSLGVVAWQNRFRSARRVSAFIQRSCVRARWARDHERVVGVRFMENEFTRGHTYGSGYLYLFLFFCIFVFLTRPSPFILFSLSLFLSLFSFPFSFVHLSFYPHVISVNNYGICAIIEKITGQRWRIIEESKSRSMRILLRY